MRSQGVKGGKPPKFLAHLVILRFEKRCPEKNIVARLKSNDLASPKLSAGYATVWISNEVNRSDDHVRKAVRVDRNRRHI